MPHKLSEAEQPFVDRSVWAEPLFKFAQVSRLVISLYDRHGRRWCGPCFSQGLAACLARAGIWEEGAWGREHEQRLVKRCVQRKEAVYDCVFGFLGQLALPCPHQGEVVLVLVLGWAPQHGADTETLKDLAETLRLPLEEIWQQIRMMPPISEERLRMHGYMLEIFSDSLLQKRELTDWKILSDTAFALAGATSEHDICQIAHRALRGILRHAHCVIKLIPPDGPLGTALLYENEDRGLISMMPHVTSVRQHISIPILAKRDQLFGQIDVTLEYGQVLEPYRETLSILAGQLGVALQKSRILRLWEKEQSALESGRADILRQHKVKDDFLAAVSHELKMPLNAIMGWARKLQENGQDPAQYRDALQAIERSARHQSRLIEDLLDISQMISASMNLEFEDLDLTELLQKSLNSMMPMIQLRQQKLEISIAQGPLRLRGDRARLHQVFWNLMCNASTFTQNGGHIRVALDDLGSSLRCEVSDTGKGIAADDLARLFYCFHSGRSSPSQPGVGLGLGLAIVKHLVDMHGGTVNVESAGEGRGATFTVLLPRTSLPDRFNV